MSELAVSDTHALVWYATGQFRRLGREALRTFERADAGQGAIYIPTISLAEVSELSHRGKIDLGTTFAAWEANLFASGNYFSADLTREVVIAAERLFAIAERPDRLIAATAEWLELPLITRDEEIGAAAGVEVIW